MAVTGQKDIGLAHSEKRLWVFSFLLLKRDEFYKKINVPRLMYRSEHGQTDGRQDIRGSVNFRKLEVHEIWSDRIVKSTGNTFILNIYSEQLYNLIYSLKKYI